MKLMKKDMGGAAHALGLAALIMDAGLPVRLRVLIPAVENAVSAESFRPGDVLPTRKGLTIEVNNTDAEGRIILADALAEADSESPAVLIDFATLTGAARVALGPDLPALFSNDDALADALLAHGRRLDDPLWRLPLWPGYRSQIDGSVGVVDNAPEGGMAGAITAALFLEKFVSPTVPWAHIDCYAWAPRARPGRAAGAAAQGLRATFAMLRERFG
jgi:leucyl aminopeptidase